MEEIAREEQHCRSREALTEWRSSEQVENGITSTSPPYWDSEDDCSGPKPSELYGKYTWKIDMFSQINKRELRSTVFEVGGYEWYILIYPQGCDVSNHLSLFLCVANHERFLPGWSHFAQFTISVVNKDPKKSKYSDTLHRFWKKEHDWGWKKFMELSKLSDGFIDNDTLIVKAQVQLIRERADHPFRCLYRHYRRELVRVYSSNVEQICRLFVEERYSRLVKFMEDKDRWSSFCAFWLGMDQNSRRCMSKEKSDAILKVLVKHFFIEKEVTSTLVIDSLYSGLKALQGKYVGNKGKVGCSDTEEQPVSIVRMEKDMFVLVDDLLQLLERVNLDMLPLLPKDVKGPQNRTKDGTSGDAFNTYSIERDEKRLTELGRRTIEIVALSQIFSKIEGSYKEAIALMRQEELIREEEEAEIEHKSKRGTSEKKKKSKKKQGKQKCNNHKMKDKESSVILQDKTGGKLSTTEGKKYITEEMETVVEKPDTPEEILDVSDSVECFPDIHNHDSEGRYAHNGIAGRRSPALDDSSSTCSTDSTPSVMIMNTPYRGNLSNHKDQTSPSSKEKQKVTILDVTQLGDTSGSSRATGIELHASVLPSNDQLEVQKEVVILQQKGHSEAYTDGPSMNRTSVQSSPKDLISTVKSKPELKSSVHANNPSSVNKPVKSAKPSSQQVPYTAATPLTHQVSVTGEKLSSQLASRPFSAPIVARPRSATPVVSVAQTPPLTHSYVTRSYRNAMMGSPVTVSSAAVYDQPHPSSVVNPSQSYSQAPHALVPEPFLQRMVNHGMMRNGPQWIESPPQWDTRNFDLYKPAKCGTHDGLPSMLPVGTSSRQSPTVFTDDFPHLDIINDLLDDEHGLGMGSEEDGSSQCFSNGVHHLTRHSTFPGDHGISSDVGPSTDSCRLKRTQSCHDDFFQHAYSGTFINGVWDTIPDTSQPSSVNWQMVGSDPYHMLPDYSNLSSNQL